MGRSYTSRNSNSKAVHIHHEVTGQVRIGKIAYNGDRTSQLLIIFKNEIVTNY